MDEENEKDQEDNKNFSFEEEYHARDRKEAKRQKKIVSATDRSKYKKSDRDQLKKQAKKEAPEDENQRQGRVLSITGQGISVDDGTTLYLCSLRGLFKKEQQRLKNLITVGDIVTFIPQEGFEGIITHVEERYSVLSRAEHFERRKEQLIAANIDQVLIVTSVISPPLKPALVDRYIIAAQKGNMQPIIVVNKIDLLDPEDFSQSEEYALFQEFVRIYQLLGFTILPVSHHTEEGIDKLKQVMHKKTSVFSGQSGGGKSSLINAVTGLELATGGLAQKTGKGTHTTTTAQLIPLKEGGWCIDTPGIRSFGIWSLQKEEIERFYEEIYRAGKGCKFPDCSHTHEPHCAVLTALEKGEIAPFRYDSYCSLLKNVEEEERKR